MYVDTLATNKHLNQISKEYNFLTFHLINRKAIFINNLVPSTPQHAANKFNFLQALSQVCVVKPSFPELSNLSNSAGPDN